MEALKHHLGLIPEGAYNGGESDKVHEGVRSVWKYAAVKNVAMS